MTAKLPNSEIRKLKAKAQHLEPVVRVGKAGLTAVVLAAADQALSAKQLIKIRFDQEREERRALAGQIAADTGSHLIMEVGKVAVFFRPKPESESGPPPRR